jgi:uncharacterized membrane protein
MEFCRKCGTQVSEEDIKCGSCGADLDNPQYSVKVFDILKTSLKFVLKKPFRLWGLSLLCSLMTILATFFAVLPIFVGAVVAVLQLGMTAVFLDGYRGKNINANQLFRGFNRQFFRNAGGMGWMYLWVLIWALIPIVGPFIAIAKVYAYRFTPYILNNEPEIGAIDALEKSKAQTKGYRLQMFGADILTGLIIFGVSLILGLLVAATAAIPPLTFFFAFILGLFAICVSALAPLFFGIIQAAFYVRITRKR